MNLLETLLSPDNAAIIDSMSGSLGLDASQTQDALGQMLPSLTKALGSNASSADGLGSLIGAVQSGNHQRYVESPELLGQADSLADGNNILGHILGSKDVSRQLAGQAAESTGISADILKKMLPMLATAAMGALSQKAGSADLASGGLSTDALSGLSSFLDADGDGSIADDLMDMAAKSFFK